MKKVVREWDQEQFRIAKGNYTKFFLFVRDKVSGNPNMHTVLDMYTANKEEQTELLVVLDVIGIAEKNQLPLREVKRVQLNEDGTVSVAS